MVNLELFFVLVFFHFLADYPLQGSFLAEAKNRHTAIGKMFWPHALGAHSFIQGGFVYLATGVVWLGLAEVLLHFSIDFAKCDNKINLHQDQLLHIACKGLWVLLVARGFQ